MDQQNRPASQGAAATAQGQLEQLLGHFRRSLLGKAVLLTLLGLCALLWPGPSLRLLVQVVGVFCLVDGMAGLLMAARSPEGRFFLGEAILSLLIGALLLLWPGAAEVVLMLFGAWALYNGIRNVLFSRQLVAEDPARNALRYTGIAGCVIGAVLLLWPGQTLAWLLGGAALLLAALLALVSNRLKHARVRVESFR